MSDHATRPDADRATTPVVGVVILVALAVLLGASVSTGAFGVASRLSQPAPTVAHSTATFETGPSTGCGDNQVRVVHDGGDPVPVADLALVVRVPASDARARLVEFPLAGTQLQDENVVDDDRNLVYDNCVGGVLADGGQEWVAGTALAIELNAGGETIAPGERIAVTVVHTPSKSTIVETRVTAT